MTIYLFSGADDEKVIFEAVVSDPPENLFNLCDMAQADPKITQFKVMHGEKVLDMTYFGRSGYPKSVKKWSWEKKAAVSEPRLLGYTVVVEIPPGHPENPRETLLTSICYDGKEPMLLPNKLDTLKRGVGMAHALSDKECTYHLAEIRILQPIEV